MAEFTVLILKVAFLVILWLFIAIIAVVVNHDIRAGRPKKERGKKPNKESRKSKPSKGDPWVLAIDSGSRQGERLQLVSEVHIGRSPTCELILDDDFISGTHAVIRRTNDDQWTITDAGSTNGTFVNGKKVTEPTVVTTHDTMRIGDVQMRLEV